MTSRCRFPAVAVLLLAATSSLAQIRGEDAAREVIAVQATLDVRAIGQLRSDFTPFEVELTSLRRLDSVSSVWAGRVTSLSHWRSYVVFITADNVIRLGGFPAPQVDRFSEALPSIRTSSREAVWERATLLALVADDESGVIYLQRDRDSEASKAWIRKRPTGWPADTIEFLPNATTRVTVTTLSSGAWLHEGPIWIPISYVFLFAKTGTLKGWSVHKGAPFGLQ